MIEFITDSTEVEIPDALVENQIDYMVQDMEYRMQYQGLKLADFLKYTNQTMADYRKTFTDQAKKSVKQQLVIDAIIKAENIEATDDDVAAEYDKLAKMYNMDVDAVKKAIPADTLKGDITSRKAVDFIKDNAVVTEEKATAKKTTEKKETAEKKPAAKKTTTTKTIIFI